MRIVLGARALGAPAARSAPSYGRARRASGRDWTAVGALPAAVLRRSSRHANRRGQAVTPNHGWGERNRASGRALPRGPREGRLRQRRRGRCLPAASTGGSCRVRGRFSPAKRAANAFRRNSQAVRLWTPRARGWAGPSHPENRGSLGVAKSTFSCQSPEGCSIFVLTPPWRRSGAPFRRTRAARRLVRHVRGGPSAGTRRHTTPRRVR